MAGSSGASPKVAPPSLTKAGVGSLSVSPLPKFKAAATPKYGPWAGGLVTKGGSAKPSSTKNYKLSKPSAPKVKSSGGGGSIFGAITAPIAGVVHTASDVLHEAGKLGSGALHAVESVPGDVANFGVHTADGAAALGSAFLSDLTHGRLIGSSVPRLPSQQSQTAKLIGTGLKSDPFVQAVSQGSPGPIFHQPLQAALDLAGGAGLADRGLGALARTGALGSKIAGAADLTPIQRVVMPSLETPDGAAAVGSPSDALTTSLQRVPRGLVQGAATKYLVNSHPGLYTGAENVGTVFRHPLTTVGDLVRNKGLKVDTAAGRKLDTNVDVLLAAHRGANQAEQHTFVKAINDNQPKSLAAAHIAPQLVNGLPSDTARAEEALRGLKSSYQDARHRDYLAGNALTALHSGDALHEDLGAARDLLNKSGQRELDKAQMGEPFNPNLIKNQLLGHKLDENALKNSQLNEGNIDAVLHEAVLPQAQRAAATLRGLQQSVNQRLIDNRILPEEQIQRRELQGPAIANQVAEILPKSSSIPSARQLAFREADSSTKAALKDLTSAKIQKKLAMRSRLPEHTELDAARQALSEAQRQNAKREGIYLGRHGRNPEATPSTAADEQRLAEKEQNLQAAHDRLDAAKAAVALRRQRIKTGFDSAIAAKKDELSDARGMRTSLAPYQNERLTDHGTTVVRDPNHVSRFNPNGYRNVSNDELRQRLADKGVTDYAYLSGLHEDPVKSSVLDANRATGRGGYNGSRYEGASTTAGTHEPGYSGVARSILRGLRTVHNTKFTDDLVHSFAHGPAEGGTYESWNYQADQRALEQRTGETFVPVQVRPQALSAEQAHAVDSAKSVEDAERMQDQFTLQNMRNIDAGTKDIVLMPQRVIDRVEAHIKASQPLPVLTKSNRYARMAFLPFSPKFSASILGEGFARSPLQSTLGLVPNLRAYSKVHDALDPEVAAKIDSLTGAGTHAGMHARDVHQDVIRPQDEAAPAGIHKALSTAVSSYRHVMEGVLQGARKMEQMQAKTAVGHYYRTMAHEMGGGMYSTTEDMHKLVAEGVNADPARIIDISKNINRVLGKYNALSPAERTVVNNFMPFYPWYRNAIEFMYATLPHDHPLLTAALNEVGTSNAKNWAGEHAGLPADMQDYLPVAGGEKDWLRFTPAGIAPDIRDPANSLGDLVVPGISGAFDALRGDSAFGTQLYNAQGKPLTPGQRLELAISNAAAGMVGGLPQIERAAEAGYGIKPSGDSTLWSIHAKHNTPPAGGFDWQAALNKLLNPVPTQTYGAHSGIKGLPAIRGLPAIKGLPAVKGLPVIK